MKPCNKGQHPPVRFRDLSSTLGNPSSEGKKYSTETGNALRRLIMGSLSSRLNNWLVIAAADLIK